jgi:hypothetical protein
MGRKAESTPQLILQPHISGGKLRMVMQWTICGGFPLFFSLEKSVRPDRSRIINNRIVPKKAVICFLGGLTFFLLRYIVEETKHPVMSIR